MHGFDRYIPSPSAQGHKYALTAVCMLTGNVFCEPLKTKQAKEVVQTYIDHISCKFRGSLKILTDNGTEFQNEPFDKVAKKLGVIHKRHTAPYHPLIKAYQSNLGVGPSHPSGLHHLQLHAN